MSNDVEDPEISSLLLPPQELATQLHNQNPPQGELLQPISGEIQRIENRPGFNDNDEYYANREHWRREILESRKEAKQERSRTSLENRKKEIKLKIDKRCKSASPNLRIHHRGKTRKKRKRRKRNTSKRKRNTIKRKKLSRKKR